MNRKLSDHIISMSYPNPIESILILQYKNYYIINCQNEIRKIRKFITFYKLHQNKINIE